MKILRFQYILFVLTLTINVSNFSQQSRTGPQPPINMDQGIVSRTTISQMIIAGVPAYLWTRGCGPTALGMVVGFYDSNGFPDLIDGEATNQTTAVNSAIANDSHYNDYSLPLDYYPNLLEDKSEIGGAHSSNCIADFMKTSWSSVGNYWGWSWSNHIGPAFNNYILYRNPSYITNTQFIWYNSNAWDYYKNEINNQRPVVILVDTDGDGSTDHFVTGIGYDETNQKYAIYNTWDAQIHWYTFQEMFTSHTWGVYGFNKFSIAKNTASIEDYENKIRVYPNPSENIFYLDELFATDVIKIEIYNSGGKKIREINNLEIDLTHEKEGIYFMKIIKKNSIYTTKIFKN